MRRSSEAPSISVVVCTYRRARYLDMVLASLVDQSFPRGQFEVLVVDNACDAETQAVSRKYSAHAPVSYVQEAKVGLVWARNTGARRARGEYVAFIDDDALAAPTWLQAITQAFNDGGSNVAVVGGPIELIWESQRPAWLDDMLLPHLGYLRYGDAPRSLNHGEWVYGGNMAFNASALHEIGGFPRGLGREGDKGHLISNEEVFVQSRLAELGYSRAYAPAALARHHVSPERLTPEWFLTRFYWQGVSEAIMARLLEHPGRVHRLRKAGSSARSFVRDRGQTKALLESILRRNADANLTRQCFAMERAGRVRGWLTPAAWL